MSEIVHIPFAGQTRNQAMRTALGLGAVMGLELHLSGLVGDQKRPRPGLGPAGQAAVEAAARVCSADFSFNQDNTELVFTPGRPQGGEISLDPAETGLGPASVFSILETVLLPLAASQTQADLYISGITQALRINSGLFARVVAPCLTYLGWPSSFLEITPGFFPGQCGEAEFHLGPCQSPVSLRSSESQPAPNLEIEILSAGLPVHLAEQALSGAKERLTLHRLRSGGAIRRATAGKGISVLIWGNWGRLKVGFCALGGWGVRPESVANAATEDLVSFLKSRAGIPADLATWLLPVLCLGRMQSLISVDRLTPELKAVTKVIDALLPGCLRMGQSRPGDPMEIRVAGQGIL